MGKAHSVDDLYFETFHLFSQQYSLLRRNSQLCKFALLNLFLDEKLSRHQQIATLWKQVMSEVKFNTGIWVFWKELKHSECVCLADEEKEIF